MRVARIVRATARRRSLIGARAAAEAERIAGLPRARLASGPGLVAAAFGLASDWTGMDLCDPASPLRLEAAPVNEAPPVVSATARIGIAAAGDPWTSHPWRLIERGHPSVSGPASAR